MVLVTGANGTIGSQVTRQLATTGCLVRAMVRKLENAETLPKTDVEVVVGSFSEPIQEVGIQEQ